MRAFHPLGELLHADIRSPSLWTRRIGYMAAGGPDGKKTRSEGWYSPSWLDPIQPGQQPSMFEGGRHG
jgi:hypothetical protein